MEANPRVALMQSRTRDMEKIVGALGWTLSELRINNGYSYIVYKVERVDISAPVVHKFARMYSQSTSKSEYQILANEVEVILINSDLDYRPDNTFSNGCSIPVIPESEFLYVMTDWNMEYLGVAAANDAVEENESESNQNEEKKKSEHIFIVEENPLKQIYTQLRALTSKTVAGKAVELHASKLGIELDQETKNSKAEGVAYLVQNAIDYYDSAATENLTQRMLNLYYGTLALMEAEMLVSGEQYRSLSEIEAITKNGHGMMTFGTAEENLSDFFVGVLDKGLFPKWLAHRNVNIAGFPDSRKKAEKSEWKISLNGLLGCIPELENILLEIDENFSPGYLLPSYDMMFNHRRVIGSNVFYKRKYYGSYVDMIDQSGKADENLLHDLPGKITLIGLYEDSVTNSRGWRVYVQHAKSGKHYDAYKTHKGLSASMVMKQLFGITSDWEVYAVMILYGMSIIVRYMPNLWARISHGDLDRYKAVFYQFSRVAERELTQLFLEQLTGKRVVIRHPQTLI